MLLSVTSKGHLSGNPEMNPRPTEGFGGEKSSNDKTTVKKLLGKKKMKYVYITPK